MKDVSQQRDKITALSMVRNIDLPEALIFYGAETIVDENGQVRNGLQEILQECAEIDTPAIFLLTSRDKLPVELASSYHQQIQSVAPPNPLDLLDATESLTVQPRPFGGSSGFGSKAADPERAPMPQHCVVFTSIIDQTRAARAAGMRVIAIANDDDDLADAVVDSFEDIGGVDDIATPGSYWLNPPHPRDDEGYAVDPELMARIATTGADAKSPKVTDEDDDGMDDDQLRAILADIAPLQ